VNALSSDSLLRVEHAEQYVWALSGLQAGARVVTPLNRLLEKVDRLTVTLIPEIPKLTYARAKETLDEELGKPVRLADSDTELAGFLYAEPQYACVLVNGSDPIARRRFSVAHELGHFIMHVTPLFQSDNAPLVITEGIALGNDENLPQGALSANGRATLSEEDIRRMEDEANAFAAVLLMPESVCRTMVERFGPQVGFRRTALARRLSADFLVSRAALQYRLDALNLGVADEEVA
jgi:Zn-dependent peptidase ImmA (M78 family)